MGRPGRDGSPHAPAAQLRRRPLPRRWARSTSGKPATGRYALTFGSDISNYYPNQGLKVYKPRGPALAQIVNYRDPRRHDDGDHPLVPVGAMRYASTNRPFQNVSDVKVAITPTDLLGQKTALFGMTRTGKSNTTKIILKAIFGLRWSVHRQPAHRSDRVRPER